MNFIVKKLTLFNSVQENIGRIFKCKCQSCNPESAEENAIKLIDFKQGETLEESNIPSGLYFFVQFFLDSEELTEETKETLASAAQEIYLESLWQEIDFVSDTIYIRKLEEQNKFVFQLFREIKQDTNN